MENDKTASWLVIVTFLALAVSFACAYLQLKELREPNSNQITTIF